MQQTNEKHSTGVRAAWRGDRLAGGIIHPRQAEAIG